VPGCPPRRSESAWSVRRTTARDRIAPTETSTPGYTLLNASVGYRIPTPRVTCELFARGSNLTNAEGREHTSFLKELAPQGARGVLVGVRTSF
jgi:iron complex outermembrane receptor protein